MLWLIPFHALPLLLDACGWRVLLGRLAPLRVLWWIATVRESVSRLLPAAGVGGELVGIRLAHWYIADINRVSASVIVEVLVTVVVQYAFSALGLLLLVVTTHAFAGVRLIGLALVLSLPVPIVFLFWSGAAACFRPSKNRLPAGSDRRTVCCRSWMECGSTGKSTR